MRLIDADELKIDYGFTWSDITPTHDELYELINRQPTIDAVPVVRCGECVYCNTERTNYPGNDWDGSCDYWNTHSVDFSWFCSQGKRKDGDGDD